MIGHRQPVPDPLEVLRERDELAGVQVVKTAVLGDLDEVVDRETDLFQGQSCR